MERPQPPDERRIEARPEHERLPAGDKLAQPLAVGVLPEGTNVFIEPERLGNLASFPPVAAATSPDEGTDPAAPQRAA